MLEHEPVREAQVAHTVGRDPALDLVGHRPAGEQDEDRDEHARVWALYAQAPAPLGYDFHAIWPEGPTAEGAALLRLDPWRLHVADAMTVAAPRVWKPVTAYR